MLSFANIAGDSAQQHFADAIADEITTAPSRIPSLLVIVPDPRPNGPCGYADALRTVAQLGLRYVVEGTVRGNAGRVRILVRPPTK